jgi:hypothetical protein
MARYSVSIFHNKQHLMWHRKKYIDETISGAIDYIVDRLAM